MWGVCPSTEGIPPAEVGVGWELDEGAEEGEGDHSGSSPALDSLGLRTGLRRTTGDVMHLQRRPAVSVVDRDQGEGTDSAPFSTHRGQGIPSGWE